jgi:hypothetical protein
MAVRAGFRILSSVARFGSTSALAFALLLVVSPRAAEAGNFIKVPVRWCAVDGSPAVVNPGGAGEADTSTVLWRRHERASDRTWKPGAEITFRSGMIKAIKYMASLPVIADPCPPTTVPVCQGGDADGLSCTPDIAGEDPAVCGAGVSCATQACPCNSCVGELGDALDPGVDGQERQLLEDACRAAWDALEVQFNQSLTGPVVVNIREFVNQFGFMATLAGRAAGPALDANSMDPADICNTPPINIVGTNGTGYAVVNDNQRITDPDELVVAHELGHVLWLRHGNGLDDDGDNRYDPDGLGLGFNCDPEESGLNEPATLMHPNGLSVNKTITNPQRLTAREIADVMPGAKIDPPGVDLDLAALGDEQRDPVADGNAIELSWAAILVNEDDDVTVFSHGVPRRQQLGLDTEFLFFADLDNDSSTGGDPGTIPGLLPIGTCFKGAEIVTRVQLVQGMLPALPRAWRWDDAQSDFEVLTDSRITAALSQTLPFDGGNLEVFETAAIVIPNDLIGPYEMQVPGQAMAQAQPIGFVEGDVLAEEFGEECSRLFRLARPQFPVCLVTPDPVKPGRQVTVDASGLFEDEPVKVRLGDLMVGEGRADADGNVSVDFTIPIDSDPGPRLVTVGTMNTATTADCAVEVLPIDPDLVEQRLVGIVFDTGEFVSIDPATAQGRALGISEASHGLSHRGDRLFGLRVRDQLLELDPATGATLGIVTPKYGTGEEGAVAFRRDGVGFAVRGGMGGPWELWRFGAIDGGAVLLSPSLPEAMDGLAFGPDDTLYGLGASGLLYWIDTEDGFAEPTGFTDIPMNTTAGLTFDPDGTLYAAVSDKLYKIAPATGEAALIGQIGFGSELPGRGFSALASILVATDTDADGVPDLGDNCQLLPNADQRDTNADGFGNLCDADLDNNCIVRFRDVLRIRALLGTPNPDADLNGDGVVNLPDLQRALAYRGLPPGPSGVTDECQ